MVKVPVPEQPAPAIVQVPEIVFPLSVPVRVSVLPAGVPEFTTKPNVPVVLPLTFPLTVNVPLAVWPETKHGELLLKVKFEMVSDPPLFTASVVLKVKA